MIERTHRHDAFSASAPPMIGPMAEARPPAICQPRGREERDAKVIPMMPAYLPRSLSDTRSEMVICTSWMMPPCARQRHGSQQSRRTPPMPWTARQTQSQMMFCAAPHSAEPIRKTTTVAKSVSRRPTMSARRPYSEANAAAPSRSVEVSGQTAMARRTGSADPAVAAAAAGSQVLQDVSAQRQQGRVRRRLTELQLQ